MLSYHRCLACQGFKKTQRGTGFCGFVWSPLVRKISARWRAALGIFSCAQPMHRSTTTVAYLLMNTCPLRTTARTVFVAHFSFSARSPCHNLPPCEPPVCTHEHCARPCARGAPHKSSLTRARSHLCHQSAVEHVDFGPADRPVLSAVGIDRRCSRTFCVNDADGNRGPTCSYSHRHTTHRWADGCDPHRVAVLPSTPPAVGLLWYVRHCLRVLRAPEAVHCFCDNCKDALVKAAGADLGQAVITSATSPPD